MATKILLSIQNLFAEVTKSFKNGEFNQAHKLTNKILNMCPNDADAVKCKVVCLIQQSCFQEALDVITSAENKCQIHMSFEKAYCLYRLNRLIEAKSVLERITEVGAKEKELLAQVLYRLEEYSNCLELYNVLIKNSSDDYGNERKANMVAVAAASMMWNRFDMGVQKDHLQTYELCYNNACLQMALGNLDEATTLLKKAQEMCQKCCEADEDMTEDEIEEEMAVLRVQSGYIHQLKGEGALSLAIYNHVMKQKPIDAALAAVVSNNIISIHKERDLFDSKKRLKIISVQELQNRLTKSQLRTIEANKCILYSHTNQMDKCRRSIEVLKTQYPSNESNTTILLEAAVYLKDKNIEQAHNILKSFTKSGNHSNDVILTLAQLYLSEGKIGDALQILQEMSDIKYRPAVVSLLVSLQNVFGQQVNAIQSLDDAVDFGKRNPESVKKEHVLKYMRESSNLKLANGDIVSAVEMLEDLRIEDSSEISTLAKIVTAYSKIDLKKAQHYSVNLPPLSPSHLSEKNFDLNILEMSDMIGSFRFSKKSLKQEEGEIRDEVVIKRKKRKRKKGRLPKSYDADVDPDPERWLPRWERSLYKHKKQKKGSTTIGKGTQGSVAAEQHVSPKINTTPSTRISAGSPTSSSIVPPRQQKPVPKSKGKKKKGKGW